MLDISDLSVAYGDTQVLFDVDLRIDEGEFVAVLGSNGAGKTTLLRAISGYFDSFDGSITYQDTSLHSLSTHEITDRGISLVQEEQAIFTDLTVYENLLTGSYLPRARECREENLDLVMDLFPRLDERRTQQAGTLSGGERKMLAVAKGLMTDPDLLMLDEPSAGLAPNLVEDMFDRIREIRKETGKTILLVEQRVIEALDVAQRAYVLENGRVRMEGDAAEIREDPSVRDAYLGGLAVD